MLQYRLDIAAKWEKAHVVNCECSLLFCHTGADCKRKGCDYMVELEQFKQELSSFEKPLLEVRDSL